jgi:hypothetical protein
MTEFRGRCWRCKKYRGRNHLESAEKIYYFRGWNLENVPGDNLYFFLSHSLLPPSWIFGRRFYFLACGWVGYLHKPCTHAWPRALPGWCYAHACMYAFLCLLLKYTQWQTSRQQVERDIMKVVSFIVEKTDLYTMTGVIPKGYVPWGCVRRAPWIGHHIKYNFVICYFVTLPLDQSKSIWSSVSCLPRYYLLKNPVEKIRSTQCLLDHE